MVKHELIKNAELLLTKNTSTIEVQKILHRYQTMEKLILNNEQNILLKSIGKKPIISFSKEAQEAMRNFEEEKQEKRKKFMQELLKKENKTEYDELLIAVMDKDLVNV